MNLIQNEVSNIITIAKYLQKKGIATKKDMCDGNYKLQLLTEISTSLLSLINATQSNFSFILPCSPFAYAHKNITTSYRECGFKRDSRTLLL
jgi:hypothetical protein